MSRKFKDWTGTVLPCGATVLGESVKRSSTNERLWDVKCTCGNVRPVHSLRFPLLNLCIKCFRKKSIEDDIRKFHEKYIPEPNSGCWLWTEGTDKDGYGLFLSQKKNGRSHRFSYVIHKGIIPDGMCILHSCDTPSCVNPDHLSIGTNLENTQDMLSKGRHASCKGELNSQAKLTKENVHEIINLYKQNSMLQRELAEKYCVSRSTISDLLAGRTWKHIPQAEKKENE